MFYTIGCLKRHCWLYALKTLQHKHVFKDNEWERNFQKSGRLLHSSVIFTRDYPAQQALTRKDEQQICSITDGKSKRARQKSAILSSRAS